MHGDRGGEKPQNRPLSKLNTGRFALRAMLPVTKLELKMFYQTQTARKPPKSPPPAATEWSRLLLRDVIFSERVPFRRCRGAMAVHSTFFVHGDLDLNLQTRLSEGPNTSSL